MPNLLSYLVFAQVDILILYFHAIELQNKRLYSVVTVLLALMQQARDSFSLTECSHGLIRTKKCTWKEKHTTLRNIAKIGSSKITSHTVYIVD